MSTTDAMVGIKWRVVSLNSWELEKKVKNHCIREIHAESVIRKNSKLEVTELILDV